MIVNASIRRTMSAGKGRRGHGGDRNSLTVITDLQVSATNHVLFTIGVTSRQQQQPPARQHTASSSSNSIVISGVIVARLRAAHPAAGLAETSRRGELAMTQLRLGASLQILPTQVSCTTWPLSEASPLPRWKLRIDFAERASGAIGLAAAGGAGERPEGPLLRWPRRENRAAEPRMTTTVKMIVVAIGRNGALPATVLGLHRRHLLD